MAQYNPFLTKEEPKKKTPKKTYNRFIEDVAAETLLEWNQDHIRATGRANKRREEEELQRKAEEIIKRETTRKETVKKKSEDRYAKSADSPKNLGEAAKLYGDALVSDPLGNFGNIARGLLTKDKARKMRGDTLILERKEDLSELDKGDKATHVDHKVPLSLGGSNDKKNLQILTKEENMQKAKYEEELEKLLADKKINKKEARKRMEEYNSKVKGKPVKADYTLLDATESVGKSAAGGLVGGFTRLKETYGSELKRVGETGESHKVNPLGAASVLGKTLAVVAKKQGTKIPLFGGLSLITGFGNIDNPLVPEEVEAKINESIGKFSDGVNKAISALDIDNPLMSKEAKKKIDDKFIADGSKIIDDYRNWEKDSWVSPDKAENKFIYNLFGGLSSFGVAMGATLVTKSPTVAGVLFGKIAQAGEYENARQAGMSPEDANVIATASGVLEGALEYVGIDRWLKGVPNKGRVLNIIATGATEAVQEGLQTINSNFWAIASYDQKRNIMEGVLESMAIGWIIGAGAKAATTGDVAEIKQRAKDNGMNDVEAGAIAEVILPQLKAEINKGVQHFIPEETDPFANANPSDLIEFPTEPIVKKTETIENATDLVEQPSEPIVKTERTIMPESSTKQGVATIPETTEKANVAQYTPGQIVKDSYGSTYEVTEDTGDGLRVKSDTTGENLWIDKKTPEGADRFSPIEEGGVRSERVKLTVGVKKYEPKGNPTLKDKVGRVDVGRNLSVGDKVKYEGQTFEIIEKKSNNQYTINSGASGAIDLNADISELSDPIKETKVKKLEGKKPIKRLRYNEINEKNRADVVKKITNPKVGIVAATEDNITPAKLRNKADVQMTKSDLQTMIKSNESFKSSPIVDVVEQEFVSVWENGRTINILKENYVGEERESETKKILKYKSKDGSFKFWMDPEAIGISSDEIQVGDRISFLDAVKDKGNIPTLEFKIMKAAGVASKLQNEQMKKYGKADIAKVQSIVDRIYPNERITVYEFSKVPENIKQEIMERRIKRGDSKEGETYDEMIVGKLGFRYDDIIALDPKANMWVTGHEIGHPAYGFLKDAERAIVDQEAKKAGVKEDKYEEWFADKVGEALQADLTFKQGVHFSERLLGIVRRVVERIKRIFGIQTQTSEIAKRVIKGEVQKQDKPIKFTKVSFSEGDTQIANSLSKDPFSGFSDITTTVLKDLVGKTSVSQQYILDQLNRPGVKQAEKDIIDNVLGQFTERVDVKEFADAVRAELLPLEAVTREAISQEEVDKAEEIAKREHTSMETYWQEYYRLQEEFEDSQLALGGVYAEYTVTKHGKIDNYEETLYSSPIENNAYSKHWGRSGVEGYFAHVRDENLRAKDRTLIRRILEIQSDLFQKDILEQQDFKKVIKLSEALTESEKELLTGLTKHPDDYKPADLQKPGNDFIGTPYQKFWRYMPENLALKLRELGMSDNVVYQVAYKGFDATGANDAINKLSPYKNTWHERIVREEIKRAGKNGITTLRFPTGETAMDIEGLSNTNRWAWYDEVENVNNLKPSDIEIGMVIFDGSNRDWVILEDLGDGRFKAVQKFFIDEIHDVSQDDVVKNYNDFSELDGMTEDFDVSGRPDVNNPIYKYYESELYKYLRKIRPDLQRITDENGVEWFETEITAKDKTEPVVAFSRMHSAQKEQNELIVRRSEIVKDLSEKLNIPIRTGKIRARALGIFKERPEVIRARVYGDISTIAHEVGHLIDKKLFGMSRNKGGLQNLPPSYAKELYAVATKPNASSNKTMEGFAEYISMYISKPEVLDKKFPLFHTWFESQIKKFPEIHDVMLSARDDYTRWKKQPAVAKVLSQISQSPEKHNRISLDRLYTLGVDELNPILKFVKAVEKTTGVKIPIEQNPYILARLNRGWAARAEVFLQNHTFDHNFNKTGESLNDILGAIEDRQQMDTFDAYLVARRVIALKDRNIRTGVALDDAYETIKQLEDENPHFAETAEKLYNYNSRLLQYANEAGLLTKKVYDALREEGLDYVPLFRVMDDISHAGSGKTMSGVSSPIKRIKGSGREIISPTESIVKNTYAIINAADRNVVSRTFADIADKAEGLGGLIEKIPRPLAKVATVTAEELGVELIDPQTGEYIDSDETFNIFRPQVNVTEKNVISVLRDGKPVYYQVDPDLYNALMNLDQEQTNMFVRILSVPARMLRAGATLTPDFSLRNPMRDQFAAMVFSNYGFIPGFDLYKGIASVLKQDENYLLWKMAGGEHSMLVSMDRKHLEKTRDEVMGQNKLLHIVKDPIEALRMLSEFGESGTRVGEFSKGINKKGKTKRNILESAMSSREVTLDFARIGAKTRAVNQLKAFWNAQVQDADRIAREFKEHPARMNAKAILGITLPTIILYMINRDDDRYKELPEWQKQSFWIIPTPQFLIRIPKPFTLGLMYSTIPEAIMRYLDKNDPKGFDGVAKELLRMGSDLIPLIPTAADPLIENLTNYSFFQQRSLVPYSEQKLLPEDQYGTYTSELSKLIGKITKTSPRKVANLIQGYSGGLGRYAEDALSWIISLATNPPSKPMFIADIPIIKAFIARDPIGSNSETVTRFYEDLNKSTLIYMTVAERVKNGREVSARDLLRDPKNLRLYQEYLARNRASRDIASIKKQIERTLASDISKDEKKKKIREYDLKMMDVAKGWKEYLKDDDIKSVDEIIDKIKEKDSDDQESAEKKALYYDANLVFGGALGVKFGEKDLSFDQLRILRSVFISTVKDTGQPYAGYYVPSKYSAGAIEIVGDTPYAKNDVLPHELAHAVYSKKRKTDMTAGVIAGKYKGDEEIYGVDAPKGTIDNDFLTDVKKSDPARYKAITDLLSESAIYSQGADIPSEVYAYMFKDKRMELKQQERDLHDVFFNNKGSVEDFIENWLQGEELRRWYR